MPCVSLIFLNPSRSTNMTASVQSWRRARDIAFDSRSSKSSRLGSPVMESCKARCRASRSSSWEIAKAACVSARISLDSVNAISVCARSSIPWARVSVTSWRSSAHSCTLLSTDVPASNVSCADSRVVPPAICSFTFSLAVASSSAQVSTFAFTSWLCSKARSNASGASARPVFPTRSDVISFLRWTRCGRPGQRMPMVTDSTGAARPPWVR